MKILVAEDNPVSNRFIRATLEYWGHEVLAVPDGAQAIMGIGSWGSPDAMILDWEMPRVSGLEVTERIRNDPERNGIYIIMLTARGRKTDMLEGFDSGVDDYISKPPGEDELKESLDKAAEYLEKVGTGVDREDLRRKNMDDYLSRHEKKLL